MRGPRILSWRIIEYTGTDGASLDFTDNLDTYAMLIDVKSGDQELSLKSKLHIQSNQKFRVSYIASNDASE